MPFGLPSIGEGNWGQKVLDSINAIKTTADAAQPAATLDATAVIHAGNGTSDDTARLNALLSSARTAGGGLVRGKSGETYQISAPLVIGANTVLDMSGCTVILKTGSNCNMVQNYTASAVATGTGSMTSGGSVITTSLASQAAVGQVVSIAGAVSATTPLVGQITAVNTGAGTVTVGKLTGQLGTLSALVTVSGAAVSLFNREANIEIRGGYWNRQTNNSTGTGNNLHTMLLRHIDGLKVHDIRGNDTGGKYFVAPADCTNTHIWNITGTFNSAIVQAIGPMNRVHIHDISGTSGDDSTALVANDYPAYNDMNGDITNAVIEDVYTVSTNANNTRLVAGVGTTVDRITYRRIRGTSGGSAINAGDDTAQANTTGGTYGRLLFSDVTSRPSTSTAQLAFTLPNCKSLVIENSHYDLADGYTGITFQGSGSLDHVQILNYTISGATASTAKPAITVGQAVNKMTVAGATMLGASGAVTHLVQVGAGNIEHLTVERCNVQQGNAASALVATTVANRPKHLTVSNTRSYGGLGVLSTVAATAAMKMAVVGCYIEAAANIAKCAGGAVDAHVDSSTQVLSMSAALFAVSGSASLILEGSKPKGAGTLASRTASQSIRINGPTLPVDVSILTGTDGDLAFNTNAALGCGTGPVVYQSTAGKWKGLYSGLTN